MSSQLKCLASVSAFKSPLKPKAGEGKWAGGGKRSEEGDEANWTAVGCRSGSTNWRMEEIPWYKGEDKLKRRNVGWTDRLDEGQIDDGLNGWLVAWALRASLCVCVCMRALQRCRLDHCYDCTSPQDTEDKHQPITYTFIPTSAPSPLPPPLHTSSSSNHLPALPSFYFKTPSLFLFLPSLTTSKSPGAVH